MGEAPTAGQAQSATVYEYPMIAVREVIANALVHRDYASMDSCVHVRLFADRLEVSSPGVWFSRDLASGVTYELSALSGHSRKRNFRLAYDLSLIKLVESEGTGIPTAIRDCEVMQSPVPTVVQDDGFVTVVLYRRRLQVEENDSSGKDTPRSAGLLEEVVKSVVQPAEAPVGLGRDAKYCPQCPGWYRLSDIKAIARDGSTSTADKVLLKVESPAKSRLFKGRRHPSSLTRAQRADIVAKSYRLQCPKGHDLVNALEPEFVVGVIGDVNSGKSHYLTGLVYELIHEQGLSPIDVDVAYIGDTGRAMDERIAEVYLRRKVLSRTERSMVGGPFSYRLTRDTRTTTEARSILTFFDVAGEDCTDLARQSDYARYLFDATGIVLLIDPASLPSPGPALTQRSNIPLSTRAIIDNLADALEIVTGMTARELDQIVCIAIAKADSVDLPTGIWPPEFWSPASKELVRPSELRASLKDYSKQCKQALWDLGAQSIINAAETRFRSDRVCYSAVSATSQAPIDGIWENPHPIGCSVPLAQILSLAGIVSYHQQFENGILKSTARAACDSGRPRLGALNRSSPRGFSTSCAVAPSTPAGSPRLSTYYIPVQLNQDGGGSLRDLLTVQQPIGRVPLRWCKSSNI